MRDVSIPAALIAGLISFLSPCVLPLVPPYLIYLTATRHRACRQLTCSVSAVSIWLLEIFPSLQNFG